jgi:hypothetical protein
MALVKFNKSANKQAAAAAISDNTVYFPTDEQAVYLNGRKMGEANTVTSVNGKTGAVTIEVPVTSVNGKTGAVTLGKSDVGLGNVDNTADANKSVAYATKIGSSSSHPAIGTATKPVYVNSDGTVTAGTQIAAAGYKGVDTSIPSPATNNNVPTSLAVKNYVESTVGRLSGAMILVGTVVASTGQVTPTDASIWDPGSKTFDELLTDSDSEIKPGYVLVVEGAGTLDYVGKVEVGEQIIFTEWIDETEQEPHWNVIGVQRNVDAATSDTLGLVKVPSANGLSVNSTGAIQLAEASTSAAGAMSSADKTKLNALPTNAELTTALSGKKNTQTAKTSPSASGNSTSFIDTITQDAQGVITATKKTVPTGSDSTAGIVKVTAGNGLAISSGTISMGTGSTSAKGAVQVTNGNGLSISSGTISMGVGSASAKGSVQVTQGNGLSISSGVISMDTVSSSAAGAMTAEMLDALTWH